MIDNEFYKTLGDRWHESKGDAVALLRREGETKTPWVLQTLQQGKAKRVLDIGCGGGDLAIAMLRSGFETSAVDVDDRILAVGRKREPGVRWMIGEAAQLPFAADTFDAVTIMDVLEHVDDPRKALLEAARVLKTGGQLIFHTFNRTALSWLFAAKGLDWFLRDSQKHIHDWRMFIKPSELEDILRGLGFADFEFQGIGPKIRSRAFMNLVFKRRVDEDFEFTLGNSLQVGYLGHAIKKEPRSLL